MWSAVAIWAVFSYWLRALRRPLKGRRASVWLARRRWWHLALFYWVVVGLPQLVAAVLAPRQSVPMGMLAQLRLESVIGAALLGLAFSVVFRRQIQNREMLERR